MDDSSKLLLCHTLVRGPTARWVVSWPVQEMAVSAGNWWLYWTSGQTPSLVQGDAEPTDTFQMVIDNIWK